MQTKRFMFKTQVLFLNSLLFFGNVSISHLSFSRENPSEKMSCGSGMLQEKEKMSEVDGHPQQEKSRKKSIDQSSSVIDIKIKDQTIQTNTMLLKVLRAYCQKRNLLNMRDGDQIDAMMHQDGGGL
ncbi:unnamed protein product [Camellia sinensis]